MSPLEPPDREGLSHSWPFWGSDDAPSAVYYRPVAGRVRARAHSDPYCGSEILRRGSSRSALLAEMGSKSKGDAGPPQLEYPCPKNGLFNLCRPRGRLRQPTGESCKVKRGCAFWTDKAKSNVNGGVLPVGRTVSIAVHLDRIGSRAVGDRIFLMICREGCWAICNRLIWRASKRINIDNSRSNDCLEALFLWN